MGPEHIPNVAQYQGVMGGTADMNSNVRPSTQSDSNGEDDDEDMTFTQFVQRKGAISLLQSLFKTIFYFMVSSLDTYPVVSCGLVWFYIFQAFISVLTHWFDHYFALNIFKPFSSLSLLHWIVPSSTTVSIFSAVFVATFGLRVEELRGSSFTAIFLIIIFALTQGSMYVLRALLFKVKFGLLPAAWYNHLGTDYLPIALIVLHAFLSTDYYVALMGLPYRLHVIPAVLIYSAIVGAMHFTIPIAVYIAVFWVFMLKYVWLNPTYSRFTGLLLTPTLCAVSTLEFNPRWTYRPELDFDTQQKDADRMWAEVGQLRKYTISLKTSEQFGEFVGVSGTSQRGTAKVEMIQLLHQNTPHTTSSSSRSSPSVSIASMNSGDDIDQLHFDALGGAPHNPSYSPTNCSDGQNPLRTSGSGSYLNETTGLLHNNDDIHPDNQCISFDDYYSEFNSNGCEKCTSANCIQHLKFRRIVHKLHPTDANPGYIKYITMKDDGNNASFKKNITNGKEQHCNTATSPIVNNDNSNNV